MSAETHNWNRHETIGSEADEVSMTKAWKGFLGGKAVNTTDSNPPKSDVWILQDHNQELPPSDQSNRTQNS